MHGEEASTAEPGAQPSADTGKRVSALAIPAWLPLGGLLLVSGVETVRVTGAHRELFFNIDNFWVLYLLLPS